MRFALLLSAFGAGLIVCSNADAVLVTDTYTSDFSNGNLSAPLPNHADDVAIFFGSPVSSFDVVASGGNSVPAGDSIGFSTDGRFFRGTSSPASIPGFVTMFAGFFNNSATTTIQFTTANPVTEIRLSVADLETAGALSFSSSTSAGVPSSVTGGLSFSGSDVTGNASNSIQGEIVWTFASAVSNPTIEFDYNAAFSGDQTHFSGLSYTVAAIPEPLAAVWFATAFGLVKVGSRRRSGEDA
ncbi:hypothetical protein [Botrimarina colliarenosi]|nr:hypothetical protein [Botrimarina colliarenosi]